MSMSYPGVSWGHVAGQEGQSVRQFPDSQSFESSQTLRLNALWSSSYTGTSLCSHT